MQRAQHELFRLKELDLMPKLWIKSQAEMTGLWLKPHRGGLAQIALSGASVSHRRSDAEANLSQAGWLKLWRLCFSLRPVHWLAFGSCQLAPTPGRRCLQTSPTRMYIFMDQELLSICSWWILRAQRPSLIFKQS